MLIKEEGDDRCIFYVAMSNWELSVLADSSVDAATQALERLFEDQGGDLVLSPIIATVNISNFFKNFDLDNGQEYHYTPEILSNAGLHDLAKKMKTIIDINSDD